jgi:hypothetical protein
MVNVDLIIIVYGDGLNTVNGRDLEDLLIIFMGKMDGMIIIRYLKIIIIVNYINVLIII